MLMSMKRSFPILLVIYLLISVNLAHAQDRSEPSLHIDVPVKVQEANVVFDIGHVVYVGDMPFVIGDVNLLANDYRNGNIKGRLVAVLHGDAAYLVLNDAAYNINRHVKTGNPYGQLIAEWMKQGVQVELCGATAQSNHWGNADLIIGVKVDTDAMIRVTQLEQQGYTLIYQ
jgi:intracellular sulfur oxidation DsrE/DsrF family protein